MPPKAAVTKRKYVRRTKKSCLTKCQTKSVKSLVKKALDKEIEDKYIYGQVSAVQSFAQLYATSTSAVQSGHFSASILAIPPQGTGQSERVGDRIRLKSLVIRGQIYAQSDMTQFTNVKIKLAVVLFKNTAPSSAISISQYLDYRRDIASINAITYPALQIYDPSSERDPDFKRYYTTLATKWFTIKEEGSTSALNLHRTFKIYVNCKKLPKLIIDSESGSDVLSNYDIRLYAFADSGNRGGFTLTTPVGGVGLQDSATGYQLVYQVRQYYQDA